jgi:parvulin-like peptidyl-prolyl isomerase
MALVTYNIFGDEQVFTLADFRTLSEEVPGIETVKTGARSGIESFIRRDVQRKSIEAKIQEKGYRDNEEMKSYLAQRTEEFIIDVTYDQEVVQKVEEPLGQEIRDYYRENLESFVEPVGVDVQQLIVGTEEQANGILQRVHAGEATFTSMVQQRSIDSWSKAKDGMIEKYRQGEARLDYLQGVAFDLEVGEISAPVRAPGGYALVKVLAKYPARQMIFDEVGGVAHQSVVNTKRGALLTALLEDARNTVTVDFVEENFQHIKDPAEVFEEKSNSATGGDQPVSLKVN